MLEGFANAPRIPELRKRLLFTAGALAIYRLGVAIPTPGINTEALKSFFEQAGGNIINLVNLMSGGALDAGQHREDRFRRAIRRRPDAR